MHTRRFLITTLASICVLLHVAQSAPMPQENILSSIEEIQKKFAEKKKFEEKSDILEDVNSLDHPVSELDTENDNSEEQPDKNEVEKDAVTQDRKSKAFIPNDLLSDNSMRKDKMLGFFGYPQFYPQFYPSFYHQPHQQNFYNDYANIGGSSDAVEDEEIMSRANRRRPSANSVSSYNDNSPIFYIRLPPTPYMFVPGLGYISNPPTIAPLAPIPQMAPMNPYGSPGPVPQNPYSPFINVPVNFLANGKPTNVYQWAGSGLGPGGMNSLGNGIGGIGGMGGLAPQYPMAQPQRPQRPYRPKPSYVQDSKITHLKGPFLFNGRPEEIFLLQNTPYNSIYSDPLQSYY